MHKYLSDMALGSSWHPWLRNGKTELPIQEDETALVIVGLWQHYQLAKDLEFIESIYNSLIKKAADFMVEFRDVQTGLPKASYDLWEEKFGTSTFTCCTVYAALNAAADFSKLLGKNDAEAKYRDVAAAVKDAILKHLCDPETGAYYKLINFTDQGVEIDKTVDASSIMGLMRYRVLDIHDARLALAVKVTTERLSAQTEISGLARYENDGYFRVSGEITGNPWIITTLWLAQFQIAKAKTVEELEEPKQWLNWAVDRASLAGILPEQVNPFNNDPVSATPLTWSHAEFVVTMIHYLDKLEELGVCEVCNPVK